MLRAVGLTASLVAMIGQSPAGFGDRIFLATASPFLSVPANAVDKIATARADQPLPDCVAALADAVRAQPPARKGSRSWPRRSHEARVSASARVGSANSPP